MTRTIVAMILAGVAAPAWAGDADRQVAAYEACVMDAAVRASYTAADSRAIVALTRHVCAGARQRAWRVEPAAVAAAEAKHAAVLPLAIDTLRDRRRTRDAMYGPMPVSAAR